MEVEQRSDDTVVVRGNIIKDSDYKAVHKAIETVIHDRDSMILRLEECQMLSSALIGQLVKITKKDEKKITIEYDNKDLVDTLKKLDLEELFILKRI